LQQPEPTAESSTTARNRARKNSLKVQQNKETAHAIAASNHERITFEMSDDTDTVVEPEPELKSSIPSQPSLSPFRPLSPLPTKTQTQHLCRSAEFTQTQVPLLSQPNPDPFSDLDEDPIKENIKYSIQLMIKYNKQTLFLNIK
jgi:hypothetical protein